MAVRAVVVPLKPASYGMASLLSDTGQLLAFLRALSFILLVGHFRVFGFR